MNKNSTFKRIANGMLITVSAASLSACGGIGGSTIGGSLSGLASGTTLVLQNTSDTTETLTLTANGTYTFPTALKASATYNVSVLTQPTGQTCTLLNNTGTVDTSDDDVTNIAVSCATTAATSSLGGTVTGLNSGTFFTLLNAGASLPVTANGSFSFPGILSAGTAYSVTVSTQPGNETCTIANATGKIVSGVQSQVIVTCQ